MVVPAVLLLIGLGAAVYPANAGWGLLWMVPGTGFSLLAGVALAMLFRLVRTPRLAYSDGTLLVYLRALRPECVPIEHVECFFLGQGSSDIPVSGPSAASTDPQTANIVTRLSESAREFHQREVRPFLGQWCGGYIVIRGTWCEPINGHLMQRLNQRLVLARREQQGAV